MDEILSLSPGSNYDDENGNPYNYGFGDEAEDDDDNW